MEEGSGLANARGESFLWKVLRRSSHYSCDCSSFCYLLLLRMKNCIGYNIFREKTSGWKDTLQQLPTMSSRHMANIVSCESTTHTVPFVSPKQSPDEPRPPKSCITVFPPRVSSCRP